MKTRSRLMVLLAVGLFLILVSAVLLAATQPQATPSSKVSAKVATHPGHGTAKAATSCGASHENCGKMHESGACSMKGEGSCALHHKAAKTGAPKVAKTTPAKPKAKKPAVKSKPTHAAHTVGK